jgi:hypothetical protein
VHLAGKPSNEAVARLRCPRSWARATTLLQELSKVVIIMSSLLFGNFSDCQKTWFGFLKTCGKFDICAIFGALQNRLVQRST